MIKKSRRLFGLFTAFAMTFSTVTGGWKPASTSASVEKVAVETSTAVSTADTQVSNAGSYGLADNIQDGTILHCFDWKLSDIKSELENIAKAGFTAVQTSPLQKPDNGDVWYDVYRPRDFTANCGNLGTKDDLIALCNEADKYGIKVVVDVVANHTGSTGDLGAENYHNKGDAWYTDRTGVTYGKIGMPDLATEKEYVQNIVKKYVAELKDCGVDGIRWDAAKHIALPSEGDNFWKNVPDQTMFNYGEILAQPCDKYPQDKNNTIMKEYSQYISATDACYGGDLRWRFGSDRNVSTLSSGYWANNGIATNKLVYWAESHDTYSNCEEPIFSQNSIDRAYAIAAARSGATALYFSRPLGIDESYPPKHSNDEKEVFKKTIKIAKKGSTHFTSPEVAAVNHFHNALIGQNDVYAAYENIAVGNIAVVARQGGAVIALGNGSNQDINIDNPSGKVKSGTYTDEISGNQFKVENGKITGKVGSSGIAVFYENANPIPKASISQSGGSFYTDTLDVTVALNKNATSGTYKIGSNQEVKFTASTKITIGADMSFGDSVTITLTATNGKETTGPDTYTFTKKEKSSNVAYVKVPSSWGSDIYCYAYDDSVKPTTSNAQWPGEKMIYRSATGLYKYEIPEGVENPIVIFNNGTSGGKQYPAAQQPGLKLEGSMVCDIEKATWTEYQSTEKGTVKVLYVDENGKEIATAKTLTGDVGTSYTTTAATVDSYELITTPANATGKYTKDSITVKYVYKEIVEPTVICSAKDGDTFTTETLKATLSLKNATSGTYTIDNGITKEFKKDTTIEIGEGKIADTTVTLNVTATDGTKTTKATYTFNKKFNKTIDVTSGSLVKTDSKVTATASKFASNIYATNPNGQKGVSKTITIDGDASDWNETMLIAKGGAWDVANHYKGGHENCVLDTTALYAAYDDENLYVAWQMVNTTDTWASSGDGSLSDGGRVLDVPLILALSLDENSTAMSNKNTDGGSIWGKKLGLEFTTHVDRLFYMSGKTGLGQPSMFKAVDSNGNTNYKEGCVGFAEGGIEYKMATTNISSKIMGLNNSQSIEDVYSNDSDWVDYKTYKGSAGGHDITFDSFYEMKIPFSTLGITKSYVESNGIGAMLVATRGESALDCIPYDSSMLDNATGDYTSDPSTSAEKDDTDIITAPLARIGGSGEVDPPVIDKNLEVNFGATVSAPQMTGTALTLKAIAKGGSGTYTKYQYYVDGTLIKEATTASEVTWTPSKAGKYTIKCTVTDSEGKTKTSAKYFTIEGDGHIDPVDVITPVPTLKGGDGKISVSWGAVEGATAYRVFTYLNGKFTEQVNTASTSCEIANLLGGTEYGVLVLAYGDGKWSKFDVSKDVKYVRTLGNYGKPVVTVQAGAGSIVANWSAVEGATTYRVFTYLNEKYSVVANTTATSYTITGLSAGTKYGVLVLAYVNGRWSSFTTADHAYATPIVDTTKPVPTLVASDSKITVSWNKTQGATTYRIFTYDKTTQKYAVAANTTVTSCIINGLTNGKEYGVLVLAYVNGRWTSFITSDVKYATPIAGATTKPVTTVKAGNSQLTISWTAVTGATEYRVFKYVNGKYSIITTTATTSCVAAGLNNGTKYGVLVLANVNGRWTSFSTTDIVYGTPVA